MYQVGIYFGWWTDAGSAASAIWNGLVYVGQQLYNILIQVWNILVQGGTAIASGAWIVLQAIWNGLVWSGQQLYNILTYINGMMNFVFGQTSSGSIMVDVWNRLVWIGQQLYGIVIAIGNAFSIVTDAFSNGNNIFESLWNAISSIPSVIGYLFLSVVDWALGIDWVGIFGNAVDAISGVIDSIINFLSNFDFTMFFGGQTAGTLGTEQVGQKAGEGLVNGVEKTVKPDKFQLLFQKVADAMGKIDWNAVLSKVSMIASKLAVVIITKLPWIGWLIISGLATAMWSAISSVNWGAIAINIINFMVWAFAKYNPMTLIVSALFGQDAGTQFSNAIIIGFQTFVQVLTDIWNFAVPIGQAIYDALRPIICIILGCSPGIVPALQTLWEFIGPILNSILGIVLGAVPYIVAGFNLLVTGISVIWNIMVTTAKWAWDNVFSEIWTTLQKIWAFASPILTQLWNTITIIWTTIWNTTSWIWNSIGQTIWTTVINIWTVISPVLTMLWNTITLIWTSIWNTTIWIWNSIGLTIWTNVLNIWNFVYPILLQLWSNMNFIWNMIWFAVNWVWNNIYLRIYGAMLQIWNVVYPIAVRLWTTLNVIWTSIWNTVNWAWTNIFSKVWGVMKQIWDNVKPILDKLQSGWNKLVDAFTSGANRLRDTVMAPIKTVYNGLVDLWNLVTGSHTAHLAGSAGGKGVAGTAGSAGPGRLSSAKSYVIGKSRGLYAGIADATRGFINRTANDNGLHGNFAGPRPLSNSNNQDDSLSTCRDDQPCHYAGWDFADMYIGKIKSVLTSWPQKATIGNLKVTPEISSLLARGVNGNLPLFSILASKIVGATNYEYYYDHRYTPAQIMNETHRMNCYDGALMLIQMAQRMGLPAHMGSNMWGNDRHAYAVIAGQVYDTTAFQKYRTWRAPGLMYSGGTSLPRPSSRPNLYAGGKSELHIHLFENAKLEGTEADAERYAKLARKEVEDAIKEYWDPDPGNGS
jgi:phage-related protein